VTDRLKQKEQESTIRDYIKKDLAGFSGKRPEQGISGHFQFLEHMERIDRAIRGTTDLERMLDDVLRMTLSILKCDRVWLMFPCDPDTPFWFVPIERTRPEYPGAFALGINIPTTSDMTAQFQAALESEEPIVFDPETERPLPDSAKEFSIQSSIIMAIYPKIGKPWLWGVSQCSHARVWQEEERQLFKGIGQRIADALSSLLFLRDLKTSEQKHRHLFETMAQGVIYQDSQGQVISANPTACRILGKTLDQLLGKDTFDPGWKSIHEDYSEFPWDDHPSMVAIKTGKEVRNVEMGIFNPNTQRYTWMNINAVPQFRPGEVTPYQVYTTFEDITMRKTAEQELRQSEERFRAIFEQAALGVAQIETKSGRFVRVNRKYCQLTGYTTVEMLERTWMDLTYPEDLPLARKNMARLWANEIREFTREQRVLRKDGLQVWINLTVSAMWRPGEEPSYHIAMVEDITERKYARAALRKNEAGLRSIFRAAPTGIGMVINRMLIKINDKICEMTGYSREELLGKNARILYPTDQDYEYVGREKYKQIAKQGTGSVETRWQRKDGKVIDVLMSSSPIDPNDLSAGVTFTALDITERKRMEEELLKSQKLESVGILAGGIAHDFNNILMAIWGNINMARQEVESGSRAFDNLKQAEKACQRATDLAQQLITFSKGGKPVKKPTLMAKLIREATLFSFSGSAVKGDLAIPEDLWPAEVDEGQIEQVLNNLILNAIQAMPDGGIVQIEAKNTLLNEPGDLPLTPGDYIQISIQDTGIGIKETYLPKIFDPYFTTKQKGSGLGLAVVYSIVSRHAGHISVESKLGEGTTFTILLPTSKKAPLEKDLLHQDLPAGKGKILVMDDEEIVRDLISQFLEHLGYEVEFAEEGGEAIKRYRQAFESGKPFNLVILDLTVPGGMGGEETVKELLTLDPSVRAIVSSGYSNDPVMADFEKYGFAGVIPKPYKISSLGTLLKNVLNMTR